MQSCNEILDQITNYFEKSIKDVFDGVSLLFTEQLRDDGFDEIDKSSINLSKISLKQNVENDNNNEELQTLELLKNKNDAGDIRKITGFNENNLEKFNFLLKICFVFVSGILRKFSLLLISLQNENKKGQIKNNILTKVWKTCFKELNCILQRMLQLNEKEGKSSDILEKIANLIDIKLEDEENLFEIFLKFKYFLKKFLKNLKKEQN